MMSVATCARMTMKKNDLSYQKNHPETIQAMFNSIAQGYDRTNAILSFQLHNRWNKQLIQEITKHLQPQTFLDLCCGTGEIGLGWLARQPEMRSLYLLDFSSNMLACAKDKAERAPNQNHRISYLQADVQAIPLMDQSVDCAAIAYGIRNVQDPQKCFQDVHRVLKAGGYFGILELSQPQNKVLRFGHSFYLKTILPIIGGMLTKNRDAYRYLSQSIPAFIEPAQLQQLLENNGFAIKSCQSLCGGIATLLIAKKLNA